MRKTERPASSGDENRNQTKDFENFLKYRKNKTASKIHRGNSSCSYGKSGEIYGDKGQRSGENPLRDWGPWNRCHKSRHY